MKISEAIRLGTMLRPVQAFYLLFDGPDASCALGAAAEAVGITSDDNGRTWSGKPPLEWRWGLDPFCCPACKTDFFQNTRADRLIVHLNNDHRWTRERIADWVATIEPNETPQSNSGVERATASAE